MQNAGTLLRFVLFCLFFTVGASAIVLSVLTDEIVNFYRTRDLPDRIEADNQRTATCPAATISNSSRSPGPRPPQTTRRSLFTPPATGDNTVVPVATEEQLTAAGEALFKNLQSNDQPSQLPHWLLRMADEVNGIKNRLMLFLAGMGLILVTFIFFGTPRYTPAPTT
jgi:hypothetical protein